MPAGYYYLRIYTADGRLTPFRLTVRGFPPLKPVVRRPINPTPTRTPRTPRTPTPAVRPVGKISYGGFLYNSHSANTTMSPTTIRAAGSCRIQSSTMRFSGPGTRLEVALELQDRRPGSFGVTRLRVPWRVSGNTLIVSGPRYAVYANQSYRVTVVTWTNGRPDSHASPGILRVTP